ncbi:MAG: hypothetical protein HGN29_07475 [Asgard group archaeon]|nr:hypothetical protein [Asgard group archaeon]
MEESKKPKRKERWLLYPYRLAHHPLCSEFKDHVYIIRGMEVCRGCVNMYSGVLLGLILIPIFDIVLHMNFWIAFGLNWGLYLCTPLSVFLHPPRIVKDFSRMLLGVAIVNTFNILILSFIELVNGFNWGALSVIIITAGLYYFSRKYFTKLRDRRNEKVCRNCDQFYDVRCEGMRSSTDRATALSSLEKGDAFSEK